MAHSPQHGLYEPGAVARPPLRILSWPESGRTSDPIAPVRANPCAGALLQNGQPERADAAFANVARLTLEAIGHPSRSTGFGVRDNWVSPNVMLFLERLWHEQNRTPVLLASAAIILVIALVDWWTKPYVSLGFLYLFPIMFAAAFLPRWLVALLGAVCAILAEVFSLLEPSLVRLSFETLALAGCGLFVGEMVRNRRLTERSEARLKALVETSPAAIVTVDERGFIELANRAAVELTAPREGDLIGAPIAAFLPELHHALRWEEAPQFRASMQCRGHRGDGGVFTADVWFSTYKEGLAPKLAAIIVEVAEEDEADAAGAAARRAECRGNARAFRVEQPRDRSPAISWSRASPTKKSRPGWRSRRAPSRTRFSNCSRERVSARAASLFESRLRNTAASSSQATPFDKLPRHVSRGSGASPHFTLRMSRRQPYRIGQRQAWPFGNSRRFGAEMIPRTIGRRGGPHRRTGMAGTVRILASH